MTKKQLSQTERITVSRITSLMVELGMIKRIDYNVVNIPNNQKRIEFTEIGIEKIRNRNKTIGRKRIAKRVKLAVGRPKKIILQN